MGGTQKASESRQVERDSYQRGFLFPETKGKMRFPPTLRGMVGYKPARTALVNTQKQSSVFHPLYY